MVLEAVWLKEGKEVAWVNPVQDIACYDEIHNISDIEVYNGSNWYTNKDFDENDVDGFMIRLVKR